MGRDSACQCFPAAGEMPPSARCRGLPDLSVLLLQLHSWLVSLPGPIALVPGCAAFTTFLRGSSGVDSSLESERAGLIS